MSEHWLGDMTAWVTTNPGSLVVALFATAFVESLAIAGIIVPGVALLFAFAALAGQTGMPLAEALFWAGLGAVAGDVTSFAIGRWLQGRLDVVWPFRRYPRLIARGERFFHRHGGKSVVIGRFVGPIRPVIPLIAGALTMPWRRFIVFNLLSAVGWALVYIIPGFVVGSALASDIKPPPHFYPVLGISGATLVVVYLVVLRVRLGLGEGSWLYQWLEGTMARYDATHRFWRLYSNERPDQRGEFPLPSLLLSIASFALFLALAQLISVSDQLQHLNEQILHWFGLLRQPALELPMVAFTLLGDPPVLTCAAILAVLTLAFRGYYAAALHVAAAVGTTALCVWLLKAGIGINRPEQVLSAPESGAYPSGHTAGMTVLVTLVASFIAGESRSRQRWQHYLFLSLPLLPVAISRLYLQVHWLTDILGGLFLGLAITGITRASYSRFDRTPLSPDALANAAVLAWLAFVAVYMWLNWPQAMIDYAPLP